MCYDRDWFWDAEGFVMTPKLDQALRLLQMPTLELQRILREELRLNPLLEEYEDRDDDRDQEGDEGIDGPAN